MKKIISTIFLFTIISAKAQSTDSIQEQPHIIKFSGYIDTYYEYDFNKPDGRERAFATQATRHNEFDLNWGFIKAEFNSDRVRANFALQTGTFVQLNYAAEPDLLKNIYMANVAYKLRKGVWLEVGIMPSHIGIESTLSIDNWNYTRNTNTEYLPYYQSGAHLNVEFSDKLNAQFAILNGFQNIKETNDAKSFGLLLNYHPNSRFEICYNNYFGNEAPSDSVFINGKNMLVRNKYRFFNDVYAKFKVTKKWNIALVGEYNIQERFYDTKMTNWYTFDFLTQYKFNDKFAIAGRFELFNDADQTVVVTNTVNGFQIMGGSVDLAYSPIPNVAFRIEARNFVSKDAVYPKERQTVSRTDNFIVSSMAIKF